MNEPANAVAAVTHPDPYPYYAALARHRPFAWDGELRTWVAASAAAVEAVLTSPLCRVRPPAEPIPAALSGTAAGDVFARLARMSDGSAHQHRRASASAAINALDLASVGPLVARWTRALWEQHDGWRGDAGFHLPVHVVASLLGVPDDRLLEVAAWTTAFVRAIAPGASPPVVERGADGASRLLGLFGDDAIRCAPPLHALAKTLTAAGDDDPLTGAANAIGLLFQSHDATAGLIGNAIVAIGEHEGVAAEVRARVDLLPLLLDEVLRCDPPVQNTRRWVGEDGEVAGQSVRAGNAMLIVLAAANRDPAANPDPHRFWIDRPGRRSFTLGHGAHACPGGALARSIAAAALRAMLEMEVDFARVAATRTYLPSANGRIPLFA
jgi:cytochrome P450